MFPSHQLGGLELGLDRPRVAAPGPILEAVVFDLDGVLTDTASLHQAAWQRLFDEVFERHPGAAPFTESDYLRYVDGRRRTDGVMGVLASRAIELPAGDPDDPPDRETLAGLAARKDDYYLRLLHDHGPRAFASSTALVRMLRRQGVATAVVSGSRHCAQVLSAAGLTQLFDVRVDGIDAARLNLPGKPDPATFLEAARRLNVPPARAAVVEDAVAGVEAGARGGFAQIIGVDRPRLPTELGLIDLQLLYRQQWLSLRITDREVRNTAPACRASPIRIGVAGRLVEVRSVETHVVACQGATRSWRTSAPETPASSFPRRPCWQPAALRRRGTTPGNLR